MTTKIHQFLDSFFHSSANNEPLILANLIDLFAGNYVGQAEKHLHCIIGHRNACCLGSSSHLLKVRLHNSNVQRGSIGFFALLDVQGKIDLSTLEATCNHCSNLHLVGLVLWCHTSGKIHRLAIERTNFDTNFFILEQRYGFSVTGQKASRFLTPHKKFGQHDSEALLATPAKRPGDYWK